MENAYIEIDLRKFKVINSLLPRNQNSNTLRILNPSHYHNLHETLFSSITSKEVFDFVKYTPVCIQTIQEYLIYSVAVNIILQKNLIKTAANVDFMSQHHTFKYVFINETPVKKVMLFGIITAHSYIQDVENNAKFRIILDGDISCLINGNKLKGIDVLVDKEVRLVGEIRYSKENHNLYFVIHDIFFINRVQLVIYRNKIVPMVEEILFQSNNQSPEIDDVVHKLEEWYDFAQNSYLTSIDDLCLSYLSECQLPPVLSITEDNSALYNNLKVAIFFNLLHTYYDKLVKMNLVNELKTNLTICKMVINFIQKQYRGMEDPQFRFYYKSIQNRVIMDFKHIFELYTNDGLVNSIDIIELCEFIYSKVNAYLKYTSNTKITVRLKKYLRDDSIMMFLVKHVCYNYLSLRLANDAGSNDKLLDWIELDDEDSTELIVCINIIRS